jgi:hypothetical protein
MQAIVENKYLAVLKSQLLLLMRRQRDFWLIRDHGKRAFHRDEQLVGNLRPFFKNRPLESLTLDQVEQYVVFRRAIKDSKWEGN